MQWTSLDTWIVIAGVLSAVPCGLLGSFLVLRRMSMMGDAISHAVLPGLAVAFLITHSRDSTPMFLGAVVVGMLTAVLTQWIHSIGRVESSASMGVVFTVLFALGLILMVRAADHVDLDPGCVLYGAIELTPLDLTDFGLIQIPRAVVTLCVICVVDFLFVGLFYKELKISSFDPQLSTTLGISAKFMHYFLMVLVAATSVAAFESVGSILVIAMLIVPAASAHLLTDRLAAMLIVSVLISAACALLGHVAAITVPSWFGYQDTNTAGMMAVVAGLIFVFVGLMAPKHGVLSKMIRRACLIIHIVQEDVLGFLYRLEELGARVQGVSQPMMIRRALVVSRITCRVALWGLTRQGQIQWDGSDYRLTEIGRESARGLVRAHRLWETYLVKYMNLPVDHVHMPAAQLEHITDAAMQQKLAEGTDSPNRDPQGKQIPVEPQSGRP